MLKSPTDMQGCGRLGKAAAGSTVRRGACLGVVLYELMMVSFVADDPESSGCDSDECRVMEKLSPESVGCVVTANEELAIQSLSK